MSQAKAPDELELLLELDELPELDELLLTAPELDELEVTAPVLELEDELLELTAPVLELELDELLELIAPVLELDEELLEDLPLLEDELLELDDELPGLVGLGLGPPLEQPCKAREPTRNRSSAKFFKANLLYVLY